MGEEQESGGATAARRTRLWVLLGILGAVIVIAIWFQPQKLFLDRAVDDAFPSAGASVPADEMLPDSEMDDPMPDATGSPAATGPVERARAAFESRAHTTTGDAAVFDVDGNLVLRFEDLATDNGPDLVVYLANADSTASGAALVEDVVDLGVLKGNLGNQNYDLPAGTDLERYRTVVIWCRRFNVTFAVAALG